MFTVLFLSTWTCWAVTGRQWTVERCAAFDRSDCWMKETSWIYTVGVSSLLRSLSSVTRYGNEWLWFTVRCCISLSICLSVTLVIFVTVARHITLFSLLLQYTLWQNSSGVVYRRALNTGAYEVLEIFDWCTRYNLSLSYNMDHHNFVPTLASKTPINSSNSVFIYLLCPQLLMLAMLLIHLSVLSLFVLL